MASTGDLSKELEIYNQHLPEWEAQEGKYVVIRGERIFGFFEGYEEALNHGYSEFGVVPFLVKRVLRKPQAIQVTRLVAPRV